MAATDFQLVVHAKHTFLHFDMVSTEPRQRRRSISMPAQRLLSFGEQKESVRYPMPACGFDSATAQDVDSDADTALPCSRVASDAWSESSDTQSFDAQMEISCSPSGLMPCNQTNQDERRYRWADVSDEYCDNAIHCAEQPGDLPMGRTLVLKNIPSRVTAAKLVATLESCAYSGYFEYIYMPLKPKSGQNRGFAMVGFASVQEAETFRCKLDGKQVLGAKGQKALTVEHSTSCLGIAEKVERKFENAIWTRWGPVLAAASGSSPREAQLEPTA